MLLAGLVGMLLCNSVLSQSRLIPEAARRGLIRHVQSQVISIDGNPAYLSPGANIRDTRNLIIVPTAMPPDGALADYLLDVNGQVHRVWLLTPEEAAVPRPAVR
jgi:hypothetical protein